jgi:CheY-like chemotaxis protein
VVDDETDIVALVAYHLAKAGYKVSTASSGADALALARQERPALMVLDLMLPGMSGYEVLTQLRAELRDRMRRSPLLDAEGFTHKVDTAFRDMWVEWCKRQATVG